MKTGGEVEWMRRQFAIEDPALNAMHRTISDRAHIALDAARTTAREARKLIERNPRDFGIEPRRSECQQGHWPRWILSNEFKIATLEFYAHAFPELLLEDAGER